MLAIVVVMVLVVSVLVVVVTLVLGVVAAAAAPSSSSPTTSTAAAAAAVVVVVAASITAIAVEGDSLLFARRLRVGIFDVLAIYADGGGRLSLVSILGKIHAIHYGRNATTHRTLDDGLSAFCTNDCMSARNNDKLYQIRKANYAGIHLTRYYRNRSNVFHIAPIQIAQVDEIQLIVGIAQSILQASQIHQIKT